MGGRRGEGGRGGQGWGEEGGKGDLYITRNVTFKKAHTFSPKCSKTYMGIYKIKYEKNEAFSRGERKERKERRERRRIER